MGNAKQSKLINNRYEWRQVEGKRAQWPGSPSLSHDILSLLQADNYEVALQQQMSRQVYILSKRMQLSSAYVLCLLDAHKKDKGYLDCVEKQTLIIFTEKVEGRWVQLGELDVAENLYVIFATMKGASILQDFARCYFQVIPEMIVFTEEGRAKVWLNENMGLHKVEEHLIVNNEAAMVRSVTHLFADRLPHFRTFKPTNFQDAISEIELLINKLDLKLIMRSISDKIKLNKLPKSSQPNTLMEIGNQSAQKTCLKKVKSQQSFTPIRKETIVFQQVPTLLSTQRRSSKVSLKENQNQTQLKLVENKPILAIKNIQSSCYISFTSHRHMTSTPQNVRPSQSKPFFKVNKPTSPTISINFKQKSPFSSVLFTSRTNLPLISPTASPRIVFLQPVNSSKPQKLLFSQILQQQQQQSKSNGYSSVSSAKVSVLEMSYQYGTGRLLTQFENEQKLNLLMSIQRIIINEQAMH